MGTSREGRMDLRLFGFTPPFSARSYRPLPTRQRIETQRLHHGRREFLLLDNSILCILVVRRFTQRPVI